MVSKAHFQSIEQCCLARIILVARAHQPVACVDETGGEVPLNHTSPRINIRISFLPHMSPVKSLDMLPPIAQAPPTALL